MLPQTQNRVFSTSPDCFIAPVPLPASPSRAKPVHMASSVDFFYPLVDDPFLQGKITAANVMSDLFAVGITKIDHFLVTLGLSKRMTLEQRTLAATEILKGIEEKVAEAGGVIAGGQTVFNPWLLVGGIAVGYFGEGEEFVRNRGAREGDVLLLTKPIGNQLIVNFAQYFRTDEERTKKLLATGKITRESFGPIFDKGVEAMARLNLYAARLIQKHKGKVRASTDVTGFGLKGHSDNLVEIQEGNVDFVFDEVPVFAGLKDLDKVVRDFKLKAGLAAETSGGLLIVIEKAAAEEFKKELREKFGQESWVVGRVVKGSKKTVIDENTKFFDA